MRRRPILILLAALVITAALVRVVLGPRDAHPTPAVTLRAIQPMVFPLPTGPLEDPEPCWVTFRVDIALERTFRHGGMVVLTQGQMLETGELLADDEVRFRLPDPQWADPSAANYISLATSGIDGAKLAFGPRGREGRGLRILLPRGGPRDGIVHLTFGDKSGGSPGMRLPPYPLQIELVAGTDADAAGQIAYSPQTLTVRCVGTRPERLALLVPSTVTTPLVPITIMVLQGLDDGHHQQAPCESFEGKVEIEGVDGSRVEPATIRLGPEERGVTRVEVALENPACGRLRARLAGLDLVTESNPFAGTPRGALRLFWGSLQNHSAVGGHGAGTPDQSYAFARNVAALDFFALTEHAGARAFHWPWLRKMADQATTRGRFVAFPGYEWSHPEAGHRHVILRTSESESFAVSGANEQGEENAPDLGSFARGPGSDPDAIVIAHHTARRLSPTVDHYDWGDPMPPRQLLAEIYSWHGYFDSPRPDDPVDGRTDRTLPPGQGSYIDEAFARGRFLGICADGDQHFARPGLGVGVVRPKGGRRLCRHGLTAVWARSLERDAIFTALEQRRCYGTTGARILVWFACGTAAMGAETRSVYPPTFDLRVEGTAPLAEVVLLRDGMTEAAVLHPDGATLRTKLTDSGAPHDRPVLYHIHIRQRDGHEAWTSPIRVTPGH